ncbi:MAG TPA: hypothetical protein VF002_04960 [Gaiellaceae bacterium]
MKRVVLLLGCIFAALAFAGPAAANVSFGITEDVGALGDPAAFYATLNDLGTTENRIAIEWDGASPTTIPNQSQLDIWVPEAAIHGVRIVFAVSPAHPRDVSSSSAAIGRFAAFLQLLARAYPSVKDFVIGNEPNQPRFWQPQFNPNGTSASGAAYEPLLAASYDALKAVDPSINVIGLGLSPRGNDNPFAADNVSTSPVRFLHDLGAAYVASGRTKPLMDELGFHPYPNQNNDPPLKGYPWPKAGIPDLDRIKQAVWDAFNGTAQPVFAERGQPAPAHALTLDLDETAWQVAIPPALRHLYYGTENVITVDEGTQAQYYSDIIHFISCDPDVRSLSFFHLVDERDLGRWQSGLMRIDDSRRPSYAAVKDAIAQTHGRCVLIPPGWLHTTTVTGGLVQFGYVSARSIRNKSWQFRAAAQEDASYSAGLFRIAGHSLTRAVRRAVMKALANPRSRPLVAAKGKLVAYSSKQIALSRRALRHPGWYVYGVQLSAAMNPKRTLTALSQPFRVLGRRR